MDIELEVTHLLSDKSQHFTGSVGTRLLLGRDSASPIVFEGSKISRRHLNLLGSDGGIVLQDLSTNGTWVNGKRAAKDSQYQLHDGDLIEIPGYRIQVNLPEEKLARTDSVSNNASKMRTPSLAVARVSSTSFDALEGMVILGAICSATVILLYIAS